MPIIAATQDFTFERGISGSVAAIGFIPLDANNQPVPMAGNSVSMVATSLDGKHTIQKQTSDGSLTVDPATSTVLWAQPTVAEVNSIPLGPNMAYVFVITFGADGSTLPCLKGMFIGVK